MLYTTLTIVVEANINTAPTRYGIIVYLYSAFSSALPIIYLIPNINSTTTATTIPTVCIIVTIVAPKLTTFDVFALELPCAI